MYYPWQLEVARDINEAMETGKRLLFRFPRNVGKSYFYRLYNEGLRRRAMIHLISVLQAVKSTKPLTVGNPRGKSFDQMMNDWWQRKGTNNDLDR